MKQIKLFLTDCDGVLTDGGMYYSELGDETKKFNTRDGMAFKLLKEKNIKIGIITGENTSIVLNRAKKLKMDYIFLGVDKKIEIVDKIVNELGINYENVLYVGDDINDLDVIKKVGFSACPHDAENIIKENCHYISIKNGGFGVIRDIYNNFFHENEGNMENKNDLFKLINIPNIKISVDTYWLFKHCMKDSFFNAHIMVRMIAIDCYYKKNNYGWDWYNEMQKKRVADNPLIPKHMAEHEKEFKELIISFEKNGFLEEYPIVLNQEQIFIDGAHRLALALYFGIKRIPITFDTEYYYIKSRDFSLDWFEEHNMGYIKEKAQEKYIEICKKYEGDIDERI